MPVDFKGDQKNIEDIKETITCSKFHPTSDSMFVYGTNKGSLRLGDLRSRANCDSAVDFKIEAPTNSKNNFFTEMISSYSSATFTPNSRYIVSRDYLTVKIWDLANCKKPVANITVQDSLKSKLCEIFENDSIFDKFSVACSNDSNTMITGNYNNTFHMMDLDGSNTQYELNYKKQTVNKPVVPGKMSPIAKMDYLKKATALDFHPKKNSVAIASLNCFFIYSM
jgi:serine/threonine-protein phosphatase 2A regulatory subunit B